MPLGFIMSEKDKKFSDTRQFSVPRNTADSLREQINRANEQSLHRKRTDMPQGQSTTVHGQAQNVVPATGTARVNPNRTTAEQARAVRPAQRLDTAQRPGNASQMPSDTAQMPGNAAMPNRTGVERVAGERQTNAAVPSKPTAIAARPGSGHAAQERPVSSGGTVNRPNPAAPQSAANQRAGTKKLAGNMARRSDDLTRVTDISAITHATSATNAAVKAKKKRPTIQRTEVVYEDEGGNTVISIVKAVVYMIFVVVVSVFLSIVIINVGNDVFAFVKNDVSVDVHIPEYATLDDITQILYENELIEYPSVFKLYATLKKDTDGFLAGDYVVSPNMSYDDLRAAFQPQPKVGISEITIPEGYTTDEIIDLMVSYGIGTREGYVEAIQNYDFDYWFLEELEDNGTSEDRIYRLDGYLFPDTYQFYNSSSEVTVLNKLLKRFGQIFKKEYKIQAEAMGYTVDEIVNLASMIEKEAGTPSEFFKVSSVFHNRLNNWGASPKLESDATIVYAIQHKTGERPKLTDTSYATPYNTYTYAGLPPGPIANPSASAILAALSPADTNYYYFVSDGNITYFSETKEQHQSYINAIKDGTISIQTAPETEQ